MINSDLKDNWLKILNFNSNVEILEDAKKLKEKVQIPLTSLDIEGYILYYLFERLYPLFVNDQQNILDIIIDNEYNVLKLILYKTKKAGIHESFQILPSKLIKVQENDLIDKEQFFNKVQSILMKKKSLRISLVRIFKKKAIDIINNHCKGLEKLSFYESFLRFLDIIQNLSQDGFLHIYPEPNFYNFIKKLISFLNGIKFSNFWEFFYNILPAFNTSIVLNSDKLILILRIKKIIYGAGKATLSFNILTPEDLGIIVENISPTRLLNQIQIKTRSKNVFLINQKQLISLLLEIFELNFPPTKDKLLLIFQKILYGFRSFENHWYMLPRPKVYNWLRRLTVRLTGINLNLKKLSHWAISELISSTVDTYIGLKSNVLILLTDGARFKKFNLERSNSVNRAIKYAFLLSLENRKITEFLPLNLDDLSGNIKVHNLESIKSYISEKNGYVSLLIAMDKKVLEEFFKSNIFKFKPFSKSKAFKMLKSKSFFYVFPEFPLYKLIKIKGVSSLIKLFLPVMIDKHEF